MKVCLVCSSGGHLLELKRLAYAWEEADRFWVTFPGYDSDCLLKEERVVHAYHPTNRNIWNLFRNLIVARRVLKAERPDVIISTGAGVAIPFLYLAKINRIPTVFVESFTRIHKMSLTGKLVYPVATRFLVQWQELADKHHRAEYCGRVM